MVKKIQRSGFDRIMNIHDPVHVIQALELTQTSESWFLPNPTRRRRSQSRSPLTHCLSLQMLLRGGFLLLLGVGLTAAFVPVPGAKVRSPQDPAF
jgi:hypothetical protein